MHKDHNPAEMRVPQTSTPLNVIVIEDTNAKNNYVDVTEYILDKVGPAIEQASGQYIVFGDEYTNFFSSIQPTRKELSKIRSMLPSGDSYAFTGNYLYSQKNMTRLHKYSDHSLGDGSLAFRVCAAAYEGMTDGVEHCFVTAGNISERFIDPGNASVLVNDRYKGVRVFNGKESSWIRHEDVSSLDTELIKHTHLLI